MGTINFKTSDIITLGSMPNDLENEDYTDFLESEYDNAHNILENYDKFYYYHVKLESGYYEGFQLYIERNYDIAYDTCHDKKDAQKELTVLHSLILDLMDNCCLTVCYPGWCTGYEDDLLLAKKAVKQAIKEEREHIKDTPTWSYYEKNKPCTLAN